jgi:hypothetical protein
MHDELTIRTLRTSDGFTVYIDLKKLKPQWHVSFRNRVPPVLALLNRSDCTAAQTIVCFGDRTHSQEVRMVFCAQPGCGHVLIPDFDFLESHGFERLRHRVDTNRVPWESRADDILWRGVTTGQIHDAPKSIDRLPRVQLCLLAKDIPRCDAKIVQVVQSANPESDRKVLVDAGIMTEERLPVEAWAGYKFAIDIDGNSNSFNTLLHRQILGCCVLKVMSRDNLQQWFYGDIEPWVHYVPVKSDLSDFSEIVAWCRVNDDECRQIAGRGQVFANGLDFHGQCKSAVDRINTAFAGLNGFV